MTEKSRTQCDQEEYGTMAWCEEQCDPLIRSATRASLLLPSHKRRSYSSFPESVQLLQIHRDPSDHPITLNPSGSIGISQDLPCPQRLRRPLTQGLFLVGICISTFNLNLHLRLDHPGKLLLVVNCINFSNHFSFNSTAWAPMRRSKHWLGQDL